MADHSRLVLVNTPNMSARTVVVAEVRVRCILSYVRQIRARVLRAARWAIRYCFHDGQVLLQRRGVQFVWKCCDVVDQIRAFLVHGPDVPALGTAVVVSAKQFAQERAGPTHCHTLDSSGPWSWLGDHQLSIRDGSRAIGESPYRNQCLSSKRPQPSLLDLSKPGGDPSCQCLSVRPTDTVSSINTRVN